MKKFNLPVEGMTCASCVTRVEKIIGKFKNVQNVNVNLANETVTFEADDKINLDEISKAVEEYGYKLKLETTENISSINENENFKDEFYDRLKSDFKLALIFTIPVFIISMLMDFHFFHLLWPFTQDYTHKILLILITPVVFISGKRFYNTFIKNLKHFSFEMNSLVAIGTGAAYGYSVLATLFPEVISKDKLPHVYFETAGVIITLILMGKILEHRAKRKTNDAIKKLIELKPKSTLILLNNIETEIPINELKIDDVVIVKPGSVIPADGIIIWGSSSIDESMISGESLPVEKSINSKVIGGTINLNGTFHFKVTEVGDNSVLGQIIKLVESAQASKPPIQKLVDKVAGVFVPVVISIAIITFIAWLIFEGENNFTSALTNFIAVLIVACPCALGLATPTAIIVATGLGAKHGILIRNGESLEIAQKVSTVIFDKTGTITEGNPTVKEIVSLDSNQNELLELIASLENQSEHPLAKAIVNFAKERKINFIQPESFKILSGFGIIGTINKKNILVGNHSLLKEFSIDLNKHKELIDNYFQKGSTLIFVANENELRGLIVIEDTIKESSKSAIDQLKRMKLKTIMLTGDNYLSAKRIAEEIGFDEFKAEVLPNQKSEVVKNYQSQNEIVAMVGDGINDSPALAQADISFAISSGTDIAIESAQITLVGGNLNAIPKAINLSKKTISTIKQNLFWAFVYNVVLIPLAAFGNLNPMIAALAMSLSSVSVVSNSLRLKRVNLSS